MYRYVVVQFFLTISRFWYTCIYLFASFFYDRKYVYVSQKCILFYIHGQFILIKIYIFY